MQETRIEFKVGDLFQIGHYIFKVRDHKTAILILRPENGWDFKGTFNLRILSELPNIKKL